MPKRIDFSLNFSVEMPDDVDIDNLVVFGDFLMEDLYGKGFTKQISVEEHTLEIWGEGESS